MAVCPNCRATIADGSRFCPSCGAAQPAGPPLPYQAPSYAPRRTEGTAIASLILGIAGLIICPVIPSIIAIVLGNQAKAKIAADPNLEGEGMAKAGVIMGWIGIAWGILMVIFMFSFFSAVDSGIVDNFPDNFPSFPG